ncbi:adenosylcobinamide-phosphate synthase CbiB [Methylophaga nitratireducenticrescens]|uniref:Cobalamin biosynthesis protein CobD n=1 Tax=Methylophaga nitratireducenticrescens TaxID=754476 RepID=I1XKX7_METNJ|nr:adenosylcobinamide-phosphate synthase CbiB [Methylophaga nitratireducenticrescens]AFI85046.1 cobalamin biosynthesis protein [Methylophaga nitratireducenticrescens]AUZ85051.1 cobalamin biosynthesis protein [Methylophaga nitratireducenticrescens]
MTFIIMLSALIIDWFAGEPKRLHPLVGFGTLVNKIEAGFNHANQHRFLQFFAGMLALVICVVPITIITYLISQIPFWGALFSVALLTLCLGHRSLFDHARPILHAMQQGDLEHARTLTSRIVSRDKEHIDVNKATIESVLENGNDAVFGALFWFVIGGAAGAVAYRLVNTLDAMWGYRIPRFFYFGKTAARLDDLLNFVPARLTALSYALLGNTRKALSCWNQQAPLWDSPNAGPVMASGAGALDVQLGGVACYHGEWHQRPLLGTSNIAEANDIGRALRLVSNSVLLWLSVIGIVTGIIYA